MARRSAGKSLSPEREGAAREFVRALVDKQFGGAVGKAAEAFGISGAQLSDFLNEKGGVGMKFLEGVADYARVSIDCVVGRETPHEPRVGVGDPIVERRQAARFARENGLPEAAILKVSRMTARPGMTPLQWFRRMEIAAEELNGDSGELPVTPPGESHVRGPGSPKKRRG